MGFGDFFSGVGSAVSSGFGAVTGAISSVGRGLYDASKGIFQDAGGFASDFGGGAFSAIDERGRGGVLTSGVAAPLGRRAGTAAGNLFGDIAESFIKAQIPRPGLPIDAGLFQGPQIDVLTGQRKGVSAKARNVPSQVSGSAARRGQVGISPFEQLLGQLQPPEQAGIGTDLIAGAVGGLIGTGIEKLEDLFRSGPDPLGIGGGISDLLFGEDEDLASQTAVALPGGASISQPVFPARGRVFNVMQNLSTGAVSLRARQTLRFPNPLTGEMVRYERAIPLPGFKVRGQVIRTNRCRHGRKR